MLVTGLGVILTLMAILIPHILDRKLWNRNRIRFGDPAEYPPGGHPLNPPDG
jgi:hypothetical protein